MEPLVSAGKVKILAQLGREKDPGLSGRSADPRSRRHARRPAGLELAFNPASHGWPVVARRECRPTGSRRCATPSMPPLTDPDFLAEAARQKLIINPVSGEKIAALLDRIYASPRTCFDRVARCRKETRTCRGFGSLRIPRRAQSLLLRLRPHQAEQSIGGAERRNKAIAPTKSPVPVETSVPLSAPCLLGGAHHTSGDIL